MLARFERWGRTSRVGSRPLIWIHAPSVGEGLQARPILEALRGRNPGLQLAYTYYSPSAKAFAADLDVDFCEVLPFDTRRAAKGTLDALQPSALIFSKLDVWPELVEAAGRRRIPTALMSATLSIDSSRTGKLAAFLLRDAYAQLDAVGAISTEDADRLIELGCRAGVVQVTGDTRFDQVIARARRTDLSSPLLSRLRCDRPTLVAGSTWPADEQELLAALNSAAVRDARLRTIIAPHEPTSAHVAPIERWAAAAGLSHATLGSAAAPVADVVIVDRVGILGELYALADVAFVGGGFHAAGLHSVVEPAAFGVPVLFGPRHHGSRDAGLLLEAGGARTADDRTKLAGALRDWLEHPAIRRAAGAAAQRVVEANAGATERSVALIESLIAASPRRER